MSYLKTATGISLLSVALSLGMFIWISHTRHQQALERSELCYQHTKEVNLPATICIHTGLAAEGALAGADDAIIPWVMLLFGLFAAEGIRTKKLEKQIKELQEKLDV